MHRDQKQDIKINRLAVFWNHRRKIWGWDNLQGFIFFKHVYVEFSNKNNTKKIGGLLLSGTIISSSPSATMLTRPLFRAVVFFILFGIFLLLLLPSTAPPRFMMNVPNFNTHHFPSFMCPAVPRPLTFPSHQRGSRLYRTKAQRPITRPDAHRTGEDVWAQRADAVREAFLQAYNSYVTHAAPHDELLPLSKAPKDKCVVFFASRLCSPLTWRGAGFGGSCLRPQLQRLVRDVYRGS
jgi:hypothetical protein